MELSIKSLESSGAFTGAPVQKSITWTMGGKEHTATVYVRPLSYASTVVDLLARRDNYDGIAGRIASSIVDSKGEPVFTIADITGEANPDRGPLDGNLTMALLSVIGEVNGLGKQTAKAPAKRPSSPRSKKPGTN